MKKITLKNDFHNREVSLLVPPDGMLSKRQVSRAKQILCGISGCTCGDSLGCRGRQDGSFVIHPNFNGTAQVEFLDV